MDKMLPKIWVLCVALVFLCVIPYATAGTITYTYDNAGRLIKADYGGGKTIEYTYDNGGNLLSSRIPVPVVPTFKRFYSAERPPEN